MKRNRRRDEILQTRRRRTTAGVLVATTIGVLSLGISNSGNHDALQLQEIVHQTQTIKERVLKLTDEPSVELEPSYTKIDYDNKKIQEKLADGTLDKNFLYAVETMCYNLDMHAMGLISVMDFETGGKFRSDTRNYKGATGLIQFVESNAIYLGASLEELSEMDRINQLDVVSAHFKVFEQRANYQNPEDIAKAVLYPKALGKESDFVVAYEPSKTYNSNKNLDKKLGNNDGEVTINEYIESALNRGYLE